MSLGVVFLLILWAVSEWAFGGQGLLTYYAFTVEWSRLLWFRRRSGLNATPAMLALLDERPVPAQEERQPAVLREAFRWPRTCWPAKDS